MNQLEGYLSKNGSVRLRRRLPFIMDCINENGEIEIKRLFRIKQFGRTTALELCKHVSFFYGQLFVENKSIKIDRQLAELWQRCLPLMNGSFVNNDIYRIAVNDLVQIESSDDELFLEHKIENYLAYLELNATGLLRQKLTSLFQIIRKNRNLDLNSRDLKYFGVKCLNEYNKIKFRYIIDYPDWNYVRQSEHLNVSIKADVSDFDIKSFYDINKNLKFTELRNILVPICYRLVSLWDINLDQNYFNNFDKVRMYVFLRFWLDTNYLTYFLQSIFFEYSLNHFTRERMRQLFVQKYDRYLVKNDILILNIGGRESLKIEQKVIHGYRLFVVDRYLFIVSNEASLQELVFPSELGKEILIEFSRRCKLDLHYSESYKLVGRNDKKRSDLKRIIEDFVRNEQAFGVNSAHISDELQRCGFNYKSNYIPSLARRLNLNIRQRLDWTWVVVGGKFDIDPKDVTTYYEFFKIRIKDAGASFNDALVELRMYYPNYRVRNALSALGGVKDKSIYTLVLNEMILGSWCRDVSLRKIFFSQLSFPKYYIERPVEWPEYLLSFSLLPRLVFLNQDCYWLFETKSESLTLDLIEYIRLTNYNCKALFKINKIYWNIDQEIVEFVE